MRIVMAWLVIGAAAHAATWSVTVTGLSEQEQRGADYVVAMENQRRTAENERRAAEEPPGTPLPMLTDFNQYMAQHAGPFALASYVRQEASANSEAESTPTNYEMSATSARTQADQILRDSADQARASRRALGGGGIIASGLLSWLGFRRLKQCEAA